MLFRPEDVDLEWVCPGIYGEDEPGVFVEMATRGRLRPANLVVMGRCRNYCQQSTWGGNIEQIEYNNIRVYYPYLASRK